MTTEMRKIRLAQAILGELSEETMTKMEDLLESELRNSNLYKGILKGEQDILNKRVFTIEEAKLELKSRLQG